MSNSGSLEVAKEIVKVTKANEYEKVKWRRRLKNKLIIFIYYLKPWDECVVWDGPSYVPEWLSSGWVWISVTTNQISLTILTTINFQIRWLGYPNYNNIEVVCSIAKRRLLSVFIKRKEKDRRKKTIK